MKVSNKITQNNEEIKINASEVVVNQEGGLKDVDSYLIEVSTKLENGIFPRLPTEGNANEITVSGFYNVINATSNTPDNYGVLIHFENNYKVQIFIRFSGQAYSRGYSSAQGWSVWRRLDA